MNWLTPLREDGALWSNMLRYCDVGINVASTVSLELFMFGKPTINVAYNPPGVDIAPKITPATTATTITHRWSPAAACTCPDLPKP